MGTRTSRRRRIPVRLNGPKPSEKVLEKSWQWIHHLSLKNVETHLSNTTENYGKRQAHHIHERQHKGRAIERMKDVKEVQRDLALIKSPAAGMKRASKEMDIDDEDIMEETETGLDTSLNIKELASPKKAVSKQKVAKIVTEIAVDAEMEEI